MSDKEIWIVFTKSRPLPGCGIQMDGSEFYFGEAYVPVEVSADRPAALGEIAERVRRSLTESRLELADISIMVRYAEHEWNSRAGCIDDIDTLAARAMQTGELVCYAFRPEEIEALRSYSHRILEPDDE